MEPGVVTGVSAQSFGRADPGATDCQVCGGAGRNIKAWRATVNGTINAGSGGTDLADLPSFIRITRVPT